MTYQFFQNAATFFLLVIVILWGVFDVQGQCGLPGTPPCSGTRRNSKPPESKKIKKRTVKTDSQPPRSDNRVLSQFPALASLSVPGYSGLLVEALDGRVVLESNANYTFNATANVQIATAYAVLKTFGPEFRFLSNVYTDGSIDRSSGTLSGNLYVSGKDLVFSDQNAVTLANELNKLGIRAVNGDLIVSENFVMNYSGAPLASGKALFSTMAKASRHAKATQAWLDHRSLSGRYEQINGTPDVIFSGVVSVKPLPDGLRLLFTHESAPIRQILKLMLSYSNKFLADRLGDMLGGPLAVSRMVHLNTGVDSEEFTLQSANGAGYSRVTPNAMMRVLRELRTDLARYRLTLADIMPVAGVDDGTLNARYDNAISRGSLIGHAGSIDKFDGGASALSGEINTRSGRLLFVIFNQNGNLSKFRSFQDYFVPLVQSQFNGAVPIIYDAISFDDRLSQTRVSYPTRRDNSQECSPPLYLAESEDYGFDTVKPMEPSPYSEFEFFPSGANDVGGKATITGNVRAVLLSREIQNIRVGASVVKGLKVLILNGVDSLKYKSGGEAGGVEIGFVSCADFRSYYTRKAAQESPFVRESARDSLAAPRILVKNDSLRVLTLLIGETSYEVYPNSTREITISAGRYKFVATAPNVIPLVGSETWDAGYRYTWTFYTQSVSR